MTITPEQIISDYADDWQELTGAEVITPEEKQAADDFDRERDHDQIVGEFLRVLADCDAELRFIAGYVSDDHLGKSPDDLTYADVGDAKALLSKLREIVKSFGFDLDDDGYAQEF